MPESLDGIGWALLAIASPAFLHTLIHWAKIVARVATAPPPSVPVFPRPVARPIPLVGDDEMSTRIRPYIHPRRVEWNRETLAEFAGARLQPALIACELDAMWTLRRAGQEAATA